MHDRETSQVKVEHDRTELIMIRSDGYAGFSWEKEKKLEAVAVWISHLGGMKWLGRVECKNGAD